MGASPALVKELKRFRARFEADVGQLDHLIVFGSQATGRARPDSDTDILLVSDAFRGMSYLRRAALSLEAWGAPTAVDVLCYTREEFERLRTQASIVRDAVAEGTEVAA